MSKIYFQGSFGAYSHLAALSIEPDSEIIPCKTFDECFIKASKDINLQSIRVHKFLTSNGEMGKVATAKFLDTINLNENSKLIELDNRQIEAIIEYVKR